MQKLFLTLLLFTATVFTNRIVKSMEPPQKLVSEECYEWSLISNETCHNRVYIKYRIDKTHNKRFHSSVNKNDFTEITLVFTINGYGTHVNCYLRNIRIIKIGNYIRNNLGDDNLQLKLFNKALRWQDFQKHETIDFLIKTTLSAHLRKHALISKQCVNCSNAISNQEPAIFLKCMHAVHETCYEKHCLEQKCRVCDLNPEEDFWTNLNAIPEDAE